MLQIVRLNYRLLDKILYDSEQTSLSMPRILYVSYYLVRFSWQA